MTRGLPLALRAPLLLAILGIAGAGCASAWAASTSAAPGSISGSASAATAAAPAPGVVPIPKGAEPLAEQIRAGVAERLGVAVEDVEVLSLGLTAVPAGAEWSVELPTGDLWGTVVLRLAARLPDGSERRYTTYTKLSVWMELPVAAAAAGPGQPVSVAVERRRRESVRSGAPVDPERRWQAKGSVAAGDVLTTYKVDPVPDLLAGEPVRLVSERGALRVEAPGRLSGDAFVGEPVEVVNLATQATVTGIYEGGGRVRLGVR